MTKEKKKKFKIRYIVIIMVIIAIAGGTFVAKQYFSTESKTTKLTFENIGIFFKVACFNADILIK